MMIEGLNNQEVEELMKGLVTPTSTHVSQIATALTMVAETCFNEMGMIPPELAIIAVHVAQLKTEIEALKILSN